MRYSFAGGNDGVSENAAAWSANYSFSDSSLYDMMRRSEAAMMAEVAPHDGHRSTILDPAATHVGIGLAWEKGEFRLTQEFIRRYVEWLRPLPRRVANAQPVLCSGQPVTGYDVEAITVHHEPLPQPMAAVTANAIRPTACRTRAASICRASRAAHAPHRRRHRGSARGVQRRPPRRFPGRSPTASSPSPFRFPTVPASTPSWSGSVRTAAPAATRFRPATFRSVSTPRRRWSSAARAEPARPAALVAQGSATEAVSGRMPLDAGTLARILPAPCAASTRFSRTAARRPRSIAMK